MESYALLICNVFLFDLVTFAAIGFLAESAAQLPFHPEADVRPEENQGVESRRGCDSTFPVLFQANLCLLAHCGAFSLM